jgi:hypothetical protein
MKKLIDGFGFIFTILGIVFLLYGNPLWIPFLCIGLILTVINIPTK